MALNTYSYNAEDGSNKRGISFLTCRVFSVQVNNASGSPFYLQFHACDVYSLSVNANRVPEHEITIAAGTNKLLTYDTPDDLVFGRLTVAMSSTSGSFVDALTVNTFPIVLGVETLVLLNAEYHPYGMLSLNLEASAGILKILLPMSPDNLAVALVRFSCFDSASAIPVNPGFVYLQLFLTGEAPVAGDRPFLSARIETDGEVELSFGEAGIAAWKPGALYVAISTEPDTLVAYVGAPFTLTFNCIFRNPGQAYI